MSIHRIPLSRASLPAFVAVSFAVSSFAVSPQAAGTKPAVERVTADTPRVTSAGATFKAPSGTPRPAREGWDERQVFDYETSPNEHAVVIVWSRSW